MKKKLGPKLKITLIIFTLSFIFAYFKTIRPINKIMDTYKPQAKVIINKTLNCSKEKERSNCFKGIRFISKDSKKGILNSFIIEENSWFVDLRSNKKDRLFTLYVQTVSKLNNGEIEKGRFMFAKDKALPFSAKSYTTSDL